MKRLLVLLTAVLATSMSLLAQHSWEEAQLIESSPGAQSFSLLYNRWFKIIVPEEGGVDINVLAWGPWTMKNCVFYRYSSYYDYIFERGTFSCHANAAYFSASDVGPGVYYFYLTGSYPPDTPVDNEIAITYTFTPCPQANDAEPNDDYQHAALLECGTSEGRLGYRTSEDDILDTDDWYKIVVPEEGQIELMAVSYGNMRFYPSQSTVYGYKNNDIYSRGSFSGFSYYGADTITFKATDVGVGTYYIKIHQYPSTGSGGYTLYYNFTPCPLANDPEPNNDYEHSNLLDSGNTVEGRLGYRTSDDVTDTDDWYKIVVPEEGQIELMAVSYGTMRFYPAQSIVYGYKNNDIYSRGNFTGFSSYGADTITFKATDVGAGTYYIKIHQYPSTGSGGYTLYYNFTPCPLANDTEPNNDYEHSNLLRSGTTVEGRLGYRTSDDITDTDDWYKIVVPEEGQIELMAVSYGNMRFYPSQSTVYGYKNNDIYSRGNFTGFSSYGADTIRFKATDVGAGTYYIKIHQYPSTGSGGYKLYYKFTPCPLSADREPNNDYQNYCRLLNGKTTEGRLGYRTSDDVTDTEDWYRIIVPKDGPIDITVTATENLTFYPYQCGIYSVQNDNLNKLSSFNGNTGSSSSTIISYQKDNMTAGIYYIRIVRNYGYGGYTLRFNGPLSDILGDVDGDGNVTIGDVTDLIDFLLKSDASSTLANADVDGDGNVTIGDVTALIDKLLAGN